MMKKSLRYNTKLLVTLSAILVLSAACEYKTEYRPADYPDQIIYMPAAEQGYFQIDDIARRRGDPPIEGYPYRYVVDVSGRTFTVPLAAYRAGINNDGGFTVNIAVRTDTINDLISAGESFTLLPSDQYSIPGSVDMPDGEELAKFDLVVDLDYLRNNYPNEVYALGVGISSSQRESNPELATTIVVIHTEIIKPTADFSYNVDGSDVSFNNRSDYSVSCTWDFGDGSEAVTTDFSESPPAHTYAAAGTYTVTLTAIGITGDEDKSIMTDQVTIL